MNGHVKSQCMFAIQMLIMESILMCVTCNLASAYLHCSLAPELIWRLFLNSAISEPRTY